MYLFNSKESGVQTYIGNRVFSYPTRDVDFYLQQLVNMYIHMHDVAEVIHPYLVLNVLFNSKILKNESRRVFINNIGIVGSSLSRISGFLASMLLVAGCVFIRCLFAYSKEIAWNQAQKPNFV